MEPTTMIAIAQFGISLFSKSGPSELDFVLKMLTSLNQKLNVVNGKLDLIIEKMNKLESVINYENQVIELKKVLERLDDNLAKYQTEISSSPKYGRSKWLKNDLVQQEISSNLRTIRLSFEFFKDFNDPITVNIISMSAMVENEYSQLTNEKQSDLKIENNKYLLYLKKTLSKYPETIETQSKNSALKLEQYIIGNHLEKRTYQVYREKRRTITSGNMHEGPDYDYYYTSKPNKNTEYAYLKYAAKNTIDESNDQVSQILEELYIKSYYNYKTKFIHNGFETKKITIQEFSNESNLSNTTERVWKRYRSYRSNNVVSDKIVKSWGTFNPKTFKKEMEEIYSIFILSSIAHQNAINALHFINKKK